MKKELLQYSYDKQLGHIPSALSMFDYLQSVFKHIKRDDKIVIGKPFGAQAYYLIWKNKGWIKNINDLSVGVQHNEIPFVDYSEETIGNALGVAAGIALTTDKRVYVNISDAALQMGNTLEAIQFIGHNKLSNIVCTVDFNNSQVTGVTTEILDVKPIISMAKQYNWNVYVVDGHNEKKFDQVIYAAINDKELPSMVVCITKKGYGIQEMQNDPKKWHYRKLNEKDFTSFYNQIK